MAHGLFLLVLIKAAVPLVLPMTPTLVLPTFGSGEKGVAIGERPDSPEGRGDVPAVAIDLVSAMPTHPAPAAPEISAEAPSPVARAEACFARVPDAGLGGDRRRPPGSIHRHPHPDGPTAPRCEAHRAGRMAGRPVAARRTRRAEASGPDRGDGLGFRAGGLGTDRGRACWFRRGWPRHSRSNSSSGLSLHELVHIRRGDTWVLLFQRLMQIVFFFHPAVWVANRAAAIFREFACDDASLALTGIDRRDCGAGFLAIAERACRTRTSPALIGPRPVRLLPTSSASGSNESSMTAAGRPAPLPRRGRSCWGLRSWPSFPASAPQAPSAGRDPVPAATATEPKTHVARFDGR